jgi:cation-transporting P-type ATPase I
MGGMAIELPRVIHALPGRVRLHAPAWRHSAPGLIEERLAGEAGVEEVRASSLTGNVLLRYDPEATDAERLCQAAAALVSAPQPRLPKARRIRVHGLKGNAELATRLVARLQRYPGVRACASATSDQLLIRQPVTPAQFQAVLTAVRALECPRAADELEGEPEAADIETTHPPRLESLLQSAVRLASAASGLAAIGWATFRGTPLVGPRAALRAAGAITILQSVPSVPRTLRCLLGRNAADVVLSMPKIAIMTLGGTPLGLAVAALEALHLYTALRLEEEAWEEYAEDMEEAEADARGNALRIEAGERLPYACCVQSGCGTALGPDGLPQAAAPGVELPAGSILQGGRFLVLPRPPEPCAVRRRAGTAPDSLYERYLRAIGPASLLYVAATAMLTRSLGRTVESLLLVNARPAMLGVHAAATDAVARVVHSGATVVGSQPARLIRMPQLLLVDSPSIFIRGLEIASSVSCDDHREAADIVKLAAGISVAANSPWGPAAFRATEAAPAVRGHFDGTRATAVVDDVRYSLGPPDFEQLPAATLRQAPGQHILVLRDESAQRALGAVVLRPRLSRDTGRLVGSCRKHGVEIAVRRRGNAAAAELLSRRAGIRLVEGRAVELIRQRQRAGGRVMYVSDSSARSDAFMAADLAVGFTDAATIFSEVPDMLVAKLEILAAVIDTAALHEAVRREAVAISIGANIVGGAWGLWSGRQEAFAASALVDSASLGALGWAWIRLRSDQPALRPPASLVDPRPERWGIRQPEEVQQAFESGANGLSAAEAQRRRREESAPAASTPLLDALKANLRSPLTAVVAAGTALTLVQGARADASILGLTLAANLAVGTWQEYRTNEIEQALRQREVVRACVLRDGDIRMIPAGEIVPGDVLLVRHGDRCPADARLIEASDLEVDEAALTGESFPVRKYARGGAPADRILLEGSDVLAGQGKAIVVAVGSGTRMGTTTAAVLTRAARENVLSRSLNDLFWRILPLTLVSGAVVSLGGLLRGRPPLGALLSGGSIALAALPEALPLLAGMGQAAAARRLSRREVLLRRPAAIEALGRVDVACVDKTGTLTRGRPSVGIAVTCDGGEIRLPRERSPAALRILRAAALASPHPDVEGAGRHATDRAVLNAAHEADLGDEIRAERLEESPFDSELPFYATVVNSTLYVKGAPEWVAARCATELVQGESRPLDEHNSRRLVAQAGRLAARGLRVLMVARGDPSVSVEQPSELEALGLLGIADPLRDTVPEALRLCQAAGIRLLMLTGDHPATAGEIARTAGLLDGCTGEILTGAGIAHLDDSELDARLEQAAVVARTTPLDKLRIIESLQRRGHAVAMTGDGVNDAPALRLADVGVALGRSATAVARHTADVVLENDDFASLVEALVEGRGFWHNLRRALALLLGGNAGELGYMAVGSVFGLGASLTVRQILAINLITDALPAFAIAAQSPDHRILANLERGGPATLGAPLTQAILRRAAATAGPALGAYLLARGSGSVIQARSIGFASLVGTQLALTVDSSRGEAGKLRPPVTGAVVGSAGAVLALLTISRLRGLFGLAPPAPLGWALIAGSALAAPLLSRVSLPAPTRRP